MHLMQDMWDTVREKIYWYFFGSVVVDRHRVDADQDPGPDSNFHVDAYPDPDWHQDDANPQADPTPSFHSCWKIRLFC
jgi:hypothetical protein